MLAVRSNPRPRSWIDARDHDLARWPEPYGETVPLSQISLSPLPPAAADAGGDGGGVVGSGSGQGSSDDNGPNTTKLPKRPRSDSHTTNSTTQQGCKTRTSHVVEDPTLPYCTQACLYGLCGGLSLDDRCPNAALHRAASLSSLNRRDYNHSHRHNRHLRR